VNFPFIAGITDAHNPLSSVVNPVNTKLSSSLSEADSINLDTINFIAFATTLSNVPSMTDVAIVLPAMSTAASLPNVPISDTN